MMMLFNDFVHQNKLKKKATSNVKFYQVLSSIALDNTHICLRDGPVLSDIGIVNLQPSKGTHGVAYIKEIFSIHMIVLFCKIYLNSI